MGSEAQKHDANPVDMDSDPHQPGKDDQAIKAGQDQDDDAKVAISGALYELIEPSILMGASMGPKNRGKSKNGPQHRTPGE